MKKLFAYFTTLPAGSQQAWILCLSVFIILLSVKAWIAFIFLAVILFAICLLAVRSANGKALWLKRRPWLEAIVCQSIGSRYLYRYVNESGQQSTHQESLNDSPAEVAESCAATENKSDRTKYIVQAEGLFSQLIDSPETQEILAELHSNVMAIARSNKDKGKTGLGISSPLSVILIHGEPGTGKSIVSEALALALYGHGYARELPSRLLKKQDLPGVSAEQSAPAIAESLVANHAGGVVILDSVSWINEKDAYGEYSASNIFFETLIDCLEQHQEHLYLIINTDTQAVNHIENDIRHRKWFSRACVKRVSCPPLCTETLHLLWMKMLQGNQILIADGLANQTMAIIEDYKINNMPFDNAMAIRRFLDEVIHIMASGVDVQHSVNKGHLMLLRDRLGI